MEPQNPAPAPTQTPPAPTSTPSTSGPSAPASGPSSSTGPTSDNKKKMLMWVGVAVLVIIVAWFLLK